MSLGWNNGTCHCKIEEYLDEFGNSRHKIMLTDGISVTGFPTHEDALKFIYKAGWALN